MENVQTTGSCSIHPEARIAPSASIRCHNLVLEQGVVLEDRVQINCPRGTVHLQPYSFLGNDSRVLLKSFHLGEYSRIHNHALINGKERVAIGHNNYFGQNCCINGEADLFFGNNSGMGVYCSVWTHGYHGELAEGCTIYKVAPVRIEDNAFAYGAYNVIYPGVTLGERSIVLSGALVTKSFPADRLIGGSPAVDVTDKLPPAYLPKTPSEKWAIIQEQLLAYAQDHDLPLRAVDEHRLEWEGLGLLAYFHRGAQPPAATENLLQFWEEVPDWSLPGRLFCLSSKLYNPNYSPLEVKVRRMLNIHTARFLPRHRPRVDFL